MAAAKADIGKETERDGAAIARETLPAFALPPLLAPSAGAFAAAAVMGFGIANQMAGAYLGLLKGAAETTRLLADAMGMPDTAGPEPVSAAVPAPVQKTADVVALKPRKQPAKAGRVKVARTVKVAAPAEAGAAGTDVTGLRALPGIGPKLETMLKARGIGTLADVAALSHEAAASLDAELGLDGRIARDGWVEKAAKLLN